MDVDSPLDWVGCALKRSSGKLFLVELKNSGTQFVSEPWRPRGMHFFDDQMVVTQFKLDLQKSPTMTLHSSWVI